MNDEEREKSQSINDTLAAWRQWRLGALSQKAGLFWHIHALN